MPDYMYLLESRLSPEQRAALLRVQELAQSQEANLYLTGGAVRDLISGMPIRDLDFTVEGNPARMIRELEKGGAVVVEEDEALRHADLIFAGDVDGSLSGARDEVYERPGSKPQIRGSAIMEDLRRRDFSINAVAISLNAHSRGLLLDPTNGLADLERREVRALSIHAFTNQPIRLMRILRFCARLGFKMESRTGEWFQLAMLRKLQETLNSADVGQEVRQLGREDQVVAILKAWEARGLLAAVHPRLQKRKPAYDDLAQLARVREAMAESGVRPRLFAPVMHYLLKRIKPRERSAALREMKFRAAEIEAMNALPDEAQKLSKVLGSRKMNVPQEAWTVLSQAPTDILAFLQTESSGSPAVNRIKNYLQKWRPLRASLPVTELDALGIPRGPKFDQILESLFAAQLRGRGRLPEDRTKLLRQLAGIKDEPKKTKEDKKKGRDKTAAALEHRGEKPAAPPRAGKPPAPAPPPEKPARVAKAESEPATKSRREAGVRPRVKAKRKPKSRVKSKAKSKATRKPKSKPKSKAKSKAKRRTKSKAKSKTKRPVRKAKKAKLRKKPGKKPGKKQSKKSGRAQSKKRGKKKGRR